MIQPKTALKYAKGLRAHISNELLNMCKHCKYAYEPCGFYYKCQKQIEQLDAIIQDLGGNDEKD